MVVFGEVTKSFLLEARFAYTIFVSHVHFFSWQSLEDANHEKAVDLLKNTEGTVHAFI